MLGCSFRRKLWLKNRVNSGKPNPSLLLGVRQGNPERSLLKSLNVGRNVQRLETEDALTNKVSLAPDTLPLKKRRVMR